MRHESARPAMFLGLSLALLASQGCGDQAHQAPAPSVAVAPPHQGTVFPLGDKRRVEIVYNTVKAGKAASWVIHAYFFAEDMTPLAPAPTDVAVKLELPSGPMTVPLKPHAAKGGSTGEFASEPGPYGEGLTGDLTATVEGQAQTAKLNVR